MPIEHFKIYQECFRHDSVMRMLETHSQVESITITVCCHKIDKHILGFSLMLEFSQAELQRPEIHNLPPEYTAISDYDENMINHLEAILPTVRLRATSHHTLGRPTLLISTPQCLWDLAEIAYVRLSQLCHLGTYEDNILLLWDRLNGCRNYSLYPSSIWEFLRAQAREDYFTLKSARTIWPLYHVHNVPRVIDSMTLYIFTDNRFLGFAAVLKWHTAKVHCALTLPTYKVMTETSFTPHLQHLPHPSLRWMIRAPQFLKSARNYDGQPVLYWSGTDGDASSLICTRTITCDYATPDNFWRMFYILCTA